MHPQRTSSPSLPSSSSTPNLLAPQSSSISHVSASAGGISRSNSYDGKRKGGLISDERLQRGEFYGFVVFARV